MLTSYRALLARTGARPLAVACALGWLTAGGIALAVILAVHGATGSFSDAGGAVAALAAGAGTAAPLRGRLIDRRGPGVLGLFASGYALAAAALVAGCAARGPAALLITAAGAVGVSSPPLIATSRRLWVEVAGELAPTAHALNSLLADVGQLGGAAVAGGAAAVLSPTLAPGLIAASGAAAAIYVAARARSGDRTGAEIKAAPASPQPMSQPSRGRSLLRAAPGLRTLVAVDFGLAFAGGLIELAVTALCARAGAAEWAALPLSAAAAGSILFALGSGGRWALIPPARRYLAGCWLAALPLAVLIVVRDVAGAALVMAASGAGIGLFAAALYELLDVVVPADRSVEAFTWLTSGQAGGLALGSAIAGPLTHTALALAFAVAATAGLLAAAVAVRRRSSLEPQRQVERSIGRSDYARALVEEPKPSE
jgi:hypothetical protein